MLTKPQERALSILRDHPEGIRPRYFADLAWPDSPGHRVLVRTGRGVARGRQMAQAAGGYLSKLSHRGWARPGPDGWTITRTGLDALRDVLKVDDDAVR